MVVAVRAVFVTVLKLSSVLAEAFLALLASKCHIKLLQKRVVFCFLMAFCTVKPFSTYITGISGERVSGLSDEVGKIETT